MFRRALKAFLPNKQNREMFPFFVCFCIGLFGFTVGFISGDAAPRWLRLAASLLVIAAVLSGFALIVGEVFGVLRTFVRTLRGK